MDDLLTELSGSVEGDGPPSDASLQAVIVFEGPKNLTQLAEAFNLKHEEAQGHLRKGAACACEAGEILLAAKKLAGHGKWLAWREQHCRVAETTAQGYMRLAKYCRAYPEKAAALLSGSFSKALRSLPVPKSASPMDLDSDKRVAEAIDNTPVPRLAARIASDKEKVGAACNCVWHLGMALRRAPPSNWHEHIEPLDHEHLQRFAEDIVARLTTVVQELGLKGGDSK
jgi:DUF3102 family protein